MPAPKQILNDRLELLRNEVDKATSHVATLSEQLEKSKVHLNMINGHFNEAAYILSQLNQPENNPVPSPAAEPPLEGEKIEDGQVNDESASQDS